MKIGLHNQGNTLHSMVLYTVQLDILRAAMKFLDDTKLYISVDMSNYEQTLLNDSLQGLGGNRRVFTTRQLEILANALISMTDTKDFNFLTYINNPSYNDEKIQDKLIGLCDLIGQHLGYRFY